MPWREMAHEYEGSCLADKNLFLIVIVVEVTIITHLSKILRAHSAYYIVEKFAGFRVQGRSHAFKSDVGRSLRRTAGKCETTTSL